MIVVYDEVIRLQLQKNNSELSKNGKKNIHESNRASRPFTLNTVGNATREKGLMLEDNLNTDSN
jgi:hypothetical protein